MSYCQVCSHFKLTGTLERIDPMSTKSQSAHAIYDVLKPNTFFVSEDGGIPFGCTYWVTVVRLENTMFMFHNEHIVTVDADSVNFNDAPTEENWKEIFVAIGPQNFDLSHYDYLDLVIESFWTKVFHKTMDEMWCAGIVGAHGDKAYGYQSEWEDKNIPFRRGVLIFLLTYTKERGDRPKHESCEWVIENYEKYLPFILEAEKEAGF